MTVLYVLAAVLIAAAVIVPWLRRASQHVDAIRWHFQHSAQAPAQPATADPKENNAA